MGGGHFPFRRAHFASYQPLFEPSAISAPLPLADVTRAGRLPPQFVCYYVNHQVPTTPDGLAFIRQYSPTQYSNNAAFLSIVYSDYLTAAGQKLTCYGNGGMVLYSPEQVRDVTPDDVALCAVWRRGSDLQRLRDVPFLGLVFQRDRVKSAVLC